VSLPGGSRWTSGVIVCLAVSLVPTLAAAQQASQANPPAHAGRHPTGEQEKSAIAGNEAAPASPRLRPQELDCRNATQRINEAAVRAKFATVDERIGLSVRESTPVVDFGAGRNTEADYIVLQASRAIPEGILSQNFEIDTREPMKRIGTSSLESIHLRAPTYTRPHFFNHRREIGFNLCISGAGADPGTYTGQFVFVGPGKIASAELTQTAQLKATHGTFWIIMGGVLLAMVVALGSKAVLEHPKEKKDKRCGSLWHNFLKPLLASAPRILLLVTGALLAMLVVYSEAPTWGENLVLAISALVATAFTAAGLGNTLTAAVSNVRRTANRQSGSEP